MTTQSIRQLLQSALELQHSGRAAEAEAVYRRLLADEPNQPEALHLLGFLLLQSGRADAAIGMLRDAVRIDPRSADYHNSLGIACITLGQRDEALSHFNEALRLNPNLAGAHNNLGLVQGDQGDLPAAAMSHRRAIASDPGMVQAHFALGGVLYRLGDYPGAVEAFGAAVRIKPDYLDALNNLGVSLQAMGQADAAIEPFQRAAAMVPEAVPLQVNLASALIHAGRHDDAIVVCRGALAKEPGSFETHLKLGEALARARQLDPAIAEFREAASLRPDRPEPLINAGITFAIKGDLDSAIDAYRQTLQVQPGHIDALQNLAVALKEKGLPDEALEMYRRAIEAAPHDAQAHSEYLFSMHYHPTCNPRDVFEEHRRWNQRHAAPLKDSIRPHANPPDPQRRLRVGYVSPDLYAHAVARFMVPLLEHHDRTRFEIIAYSDVSSRDQITARIRSLCDQWREIVPFRDDAVAELIRRDGIDILVDLAQHTRGNRLLVFARKPAPVQVTWLAYPGSSGMDAMDYRLTDPYLDPPGCNEECYSETSVRLPETYWCYQVPEGSSAPGELPADKAGHITFGCLNNFSKVNSATLAAWCDIIRAVPDSQFVLYTGVGSHRQRLRDVLVEAGIDPARLSFVDRVPMAEYLALYHRIDIALDTFPYNGGTTTCDALWMGAPVVSLAGEIAVHRAGASLLANIGLGDLVASNRQEYVSLATALAGDLPRLRELRANLRQRMQASPLMDAARFARNIEAAYQRMWRQWCTQATGDRVMMNIEHALAAAAGQHQAGQYEQAESRYRQILSHQPDHPKVLHLLGALYFQTQRHAQAVELLQRAIALDPAPAQAHYHLGMALAAGGNPDAAANAFREAVARKPDWVEAQFELAVLLHTRGQLDPAIAAYRQVIRLEPAHFRAYSNLGVALMSTNHLQDATEALQAAARLSPNLPQIHNNLGTALKNLGRFDEAIASLSLAIRLDPDLGDAHANLGNAQLAKGEPAQAVGSYQTALRLNPQHVLARRGLADALIAQGQAHARQGRQSDALAALESALEIGHESALALNSLGIAFKAVGQFDRAVECFKRAIALEPDSAIFQINLSAAYKDMGELDLAIESYRRALALDPSCYPAWASVLYTLHFHPDYDSAAIQREHAQWNQIQARPLRPAREDFSNSRDVQRRLRIGYVSPEFREHVVGRNFLPLLEHHDHLGFAAICYSDVARVDSITERCRGLADEWHETGALSDEQLAERVRDDRIDILVDLTLHMRGSRLLAFARRPAPVQVAFMGYPGTTGLETIDYRLTDPYLEPAGMFDDLYCERAIRLPATFWCYQITGDEPPVNALPAPAAGHVTFGCLNNFCKINSATLKLWAGVLRQVQSSRMLIVTEWGSHRQRMLDELNREGVDPSRIEFAPRRPRTQYLALFHGIDIVLDTLPYNGHTTTLDGLWMGVPTVTLVGQTIVGRAGLSQMTNLGLPELIAHLPGQFEQIAVTLANDLPRLGELRASLRSRMQASPLMDAAQFARDIQAAYRTMWQGWCESGGAI